MNSKYHYEKTSVVNGSLYGAKKESEEYQYNEFSASIKEQIDQKLQNNEKVVLIDKIEFKRTILCINGSLFNYDDNVDFLVTLTDSQNNKVVNFKHCECENGKFKISINVMSANNELPISTGQYNLSFHEKRNKDFDDLYFGKSDLKVTISDENDSKFAVCYDNENYFVKTVLLSERVDAYISPDYDIDYEYSKTNSVHWRLLRNKNNLFYANSSYDMEDFKFLLRVTHRVPNILPVPYWEKKRIEKRRKRNAKKRDLSLYGTRAIFNFFLRFAKKKGNVVLFASGSRAKIGGNEETIYLRMLERGMKKTHKFLFDFKESITIIKPFISKFTFLYKLAVADIILIDDYYPDIYRFDYPSDKKIVQVWHACGAFKSLGLERLGKPGAPAFNTRVHKCYTHVPVSSYHSALHHAEAFGISENKFYPIGIPRTDIFFDEDYKKNILEKLANEFPEYVGKSKVYMYAPTFRGDNALNAHFPFEKIDLQAWGEHCIETNSLLIIKMHPFVKQLFRIPEKYKNHIIDATSYREVNDMLFMVDVLITDYSSIIYEFSLLKRPILFYAFDQKDYVATRDFYEKYEDIVAGKIVHTSSELMKCIKDEDFDFDKMDSFVKKNFTYTDGKATDRFIDHVILDQPYEIDVDYSTIF